MFEIVMVDNGSTDGSTALIERHSRITLLHEETPGAYAARNTALRAAHGDVVAFTDPDCAPDPAWLRSLADAMKDDSVQIVIGSYVAATKSDTLEALASYENAKNSYVFNSAIPDLYYGYTNNMGVRARLFRELGFFAERPRGSDAIFTKKVVARDGCQAVRYTERMRVAHLEIDSGWSYCRKVFVHARSVRELGAVAGLRPLRRAERLMIFKGLVRSERYGAARAARVFLLLASGFVAWTLGTALTQGTELIKGVLRREPPLRGAADRRRALRALGSAEQD